MVSVLIGFQSHDVEERRHQEFLLSKVSQTVHADGQTFTFVAGEKVKLEESNKVREPRTSAICW